MLFQGALPLDPCCQFALPFRKYSSTLLRGHVNSFAHSPFINAIGLQVVAMLDNILSLVKQRKEGFFVEDVETNGGSHANDMDWRWEKDREFRDVRQLIGGNLKEFAPQEAALEKFDLCQWQAGQMMAYASIMPDMIVPRFVGLRTAVQEIWRRG